MAAAAQVEVCSPAPDWFCGVHRDSKIQLGKCAPDSTYPQTRHRNQAPDAYGYGSQLQHISYTLIWASEIRDSRSPFPIRKALRSLTRSSACHAIINLEAGLKTAAAGGSRRRRRGAAGGVVVVAVRRRRFCYTEISSGNSNSDNNNTNTNTCCDILRWTVLLAHRRYRLAESSNSLCPRCLASFWICTWLPETCMLKWNSGHTNSYQDSQDQGSTEN